MPETMFGLNILQETLDIGLAKYAKPYVDRSSDPGIQEKDTLFWQSKKFDNLAQWFFEETWRISK